MIDLGAEIAINGGGDLRGGEINFLGHSFRTVRYPNGLRYVFFAIDDNFDDPKDCTLLAVGTYQRMRDLKPILSFARPKDNENALISVAVERIDKPDDLMRDEKGGDLFFRPVFGVLTLRATDGDGTVTDGVNLHEWRIKWLDEPTCAWAIASYNAAGKVIHTHFVCRTEDGPRITATEKWRRVDALLAKLDPDGRARAEDEAFFAGRPVETERARDGNQRLFSLMRLP
jgi:hypothetical protein